MSRYVAAGDAALVGVGGGRAAAGVECGAAGEQRDGLGRAAVVGQGAELCVDRVRRRADLIPVAAVADAVHLRAVADQVVRAVVRS